MIGRKKKGSEGPERNPADQVIDVLLDGTGDRQKLLDLISDSTGCAEVMTRLMQRRQSANAEDRYKLFEMSIDVLLHRRGLAKEKNDEELDGFLKNFLAFDEQPRDWDAYLKLYKIFSIYTGLLKNIDETHALTAYAGGRAVFGTLILALYSTTHECYRAETVTTLLTKTSPRNPVSWFAVAVWLESRRSSTVCGEQWNEYQRLEGDKLVSQAIVRLAGGKDVEQRLALRLLRVILKRCKLNEILQNMFKN